MTFLKKVWPLVVVGLLACGMLLAVDHASRTTFVAGIVASAPALQYWGWLLATGLMCFFYLVSLIVGAAGIVALGGLIWQRRSPLPWLMLTMASWIVCLYLAVHGTSVFGQMRQQVWDLAPHQFWVDAQLGVLAVYLPPLMSWFIWFVHKDTKRLKETNRKLNMPYDDDEIYHVGERDEAILEYKGPPYIR